MMINLLLSMGMLLSINVSATAETAPDTLWKKTFGGTLFDGAISVQQTTDGGHILTVSTESFGSGRADIWLIKTAENGNYVWDQTFGGSNYDNAYFLQLKAEDLMPGLLKLMKMVTNSGTLHMGDRPMSTPSQSNRLPTVDT